MVCSYHKNSEYIFHKMNFARKYLKIINLLIAELTKSYFAILLSNLCDYQAVSFKYKH